MSMSTPHLDLLGLETFIAVAELGSFSRAAEQLGVGQPALTRRLQRFESLVGCQLLIRRARPIQLSSAGTKLLPDARQTLRQLEEVVRSLHSGADVQHVRIGCFTGFAPRVLVPALASHRFRWPHCLVTIIDYASTAEIRAALLNGVVDMALTDIGDRMNEGRAEVLIEEPLALICPKSHALSKTLAVSWKKLAGVPLISVAGMMARSEIEAAFTRHDIAVKTRIDVSHTSTALALVRAGCGVAILSPSAILESDLGLTAIPLIEPRIVAKVGVVMRPDWVPSPAALDLIGTLTRRHQTPFAARAL
jgi:DNA-binding transcriptional LysR family regulator